MKLHFDVNKKYHFWIFFLVLLFLSALMIFVYGINLSGGDDFYFHNGRFKALMQALEDGNFPSYIDYKGVYGYGYMIKLFYSDFVLIPFAAIANITSKDFGYQSLLFTMTVLCGVFMYIFVNKVYKSSLAASVSAILYTFSMYRLHDIYYRAALGEALSFTFIPIVFLGLYHIIKGDYRKWYIIAIGFSLMIMTHVLSTVLLFIMVIVFLAIYYKDMFREPKRIYYLIFSALVTLLLTAYYIYPFIEQLGSDTFYFQKIKALPYHTCGSRLYYTEILITMAEGFVTRIGIGPKIGVLLVAPLLLRFFIRNKDNVKKERLRSVDIGVIIGLFLIFLISNFAPWDKFPLTYLSFIQFPWRLIEFICFFFALAGGYYLALFCKTSTTKVITFSVLVILVSVSVIVGAETYRKREQIPMRFEFWSSLNEENHYVRAGMEYYPSSMPYPYPFILERKDSVISQTKETRISNFVRNKNITEFDVNTSVKDILELPLIYYKGYSASLNGNDIAVTESTHGLVQVVVDQSGRVEAYYAGTLVQKLSFYTTILSIFALCGYIYLQNKKRKHTNN